MNIVDSIICPLSYEERAPHIHSASCGRCQWRLQAGQTQTGKVLAAFCWNHAPTWIWLSFARSNMESLWDVYFFSLRWLRVSLYPGSWLHWVACQQRFILYRSTLSPKVQTFCSTTQRTLTNGNLCHFESFLFYFQYLICRRWSNTPQEWRSSRTLCQTCAGKWPACSSMPAYLSISYFRMNFKTLALCIDILYFQIVFLDIALIGFIQFQSPI